MVAPVQIVLPDSLRAFVDAEVRRGGFGSPAEYIQHLLRVEQLRGDKDVEAALLEGLDSGPPQPRPADWKQRVQRQAESELRGGPQ